MLVSDFYIKSINGALLGGNKLVRLTYMDEAGTSQHEPFLVVAGAVIQGDTQLNEVEDYIASLVRKHIPKQDWEGFVFHAKDIWHGTKYFKDPGEIRTKWLPEQRHGILRDLAEIPAKFKIPLAFGIIQKSKREHLFQNISPDINKNTSFHCMAFAQCCGVIERIMRNFPDENTVLIVEDCPSNADLKDIIADFRSISATYSVDKSNGNNFPIQRIRDTPHFVKKAESPNLQIADMCAFLMRGKLDKKSDRNSLFDLLFPQIVPVEMDWYEQLFNEKAMSKEASISS
jgi:hypothetical protein